MLSCKFVSTHIRIQKMHRTKCPMYGEELEEQNIQKASSEVVQELTIASN